jgi:DNA-binding XRE family transcriptional regulator
VLTLHHRIVILVQSEIGERYTRETIEESAMRAGDHVRFDDWLADQMENEAFRIEYERLGPCFEAARLRMLRGLTQQELAEKVGTRQSSISRLESGDQEPSLSFLRRIVNALDGHLEVRIQAREDAATVDEAEAAQAAPE